MKFIRLPGWVGMGVVISTLNASLVFAQDDAAARASLMESLRGMNESIKRLTDRLDVLENNYATLQKQIAKIQTDIAALNATTPASPKDIERLDAALKQVDAAREKDKAALVEQVAKMLDEFQKRLPANGRKKDTQAAPAPPTDDSFIKHTVKSGENLTVIAKSYGVTVAEIKKANQLTGDVITVGQVLVIPKRAPPAP